MANATEKKPEKKVLTPEEKANLQAQAEKMTAELVKKSQQALAEFSTFTQEQVDTIVAAMALAGSQNSLVLAHEAHDETGRGVVEDKDTKNRFASESVYNAIKFDKTVGVINEDKIQGKVELAAPLGVLAGIVPTTNPTSTTIFKSMLTAKTRNTIIFAFHPQAQKSSAHAAQIVYEAAVKAGAPKNFIQWIEKPSIYGTSALIQNTGIASILATGGPSMVNAALKSGNPSMGVGAGNGAIYLDATVDTDRAVSDLLLSKRFDNGMICATENSAVIQAPIYDEVLKKLQDQGAYLVPKKDYKKIADYVFKANAEGYGVAGPVAGMSGRWIAEQAGVKVPEGKDVLLFELDQKNIGEALSSEKLSPLLSIYKVEKRQEAIDTVQSLLNYQGAGHNAAIQIGSQDDPFIKEYADAIGASRILVNQPDSIGGVGDIYTDAMRPSLTLGTGSWGKNSLSHNLSTYDLLNIKTVARRRNRPQWVRLPKEVYYESNAITYLQDLPSINRAFIVADPGMVQFGFVGKVLSQLELRQEQVETNIYGSVKPDPTLSQAVDIARQMAAFKPDTVILLGGGSALDAGKIGRFLYEYSTRNEGILEDEEQIKALFMELQQKFMDIRKRIVKFYHARLTQMVAIPTTSGTGSEVTPFAVITDDTTHVKYPLADYELTPEVAIVDPEFVMTVPKRTVAFSGLDALSHALESYVSVMASEFTRPWALQAIKLIFDNLAESYRYDPKNPTKEGQTARTKMHYASTLAGMSFANAFLGINHSLAHKVGGEFELPHGLAIAIAMPHVIKFNAVTGNVKRTPYPRYETYTAQKDYADIARHIGLKGSTDAELVDALITAIKKLAKSVEVDQTLTGNGVKKADLERNIDALTDLVYNDQCTPGNPRQPSLDEIKQLLRDQL
ncbi:bifunctional acetaldehyde-CoA/alcohol dehydrogenase [Leuconostoc carnosum]|uniref:bifunctional acetaldehyde-CoA/alcohol dehydrogenase n=1 Tax=Leuconostoc TaxID=1243 RepID=UPI000D50E685|nr:MULTISPECIES: bifunctional acetaldehyde-CoA/alcohol dehydrogenase [Leuconostoc]KAA8327198.1 bifunctional acetaldehyde-CoA/alcohol dehydrogenase [Leuconostoc carnosum]KAA8364287.1 bifunctional acetaldehyde-CoA/alcohol dehydrogenase [Leuconostoc carnosum]KAA8367180.1 bifunctional acetaldehyde-CoA/alcohol dehydrogenase [Leuconostoc carnosum]KAA8369558.1 bifunctional acetaldehyde-CoA/alcohol dehydrogenase [Leuconostoc carnosum]KAA8371379.1 bifunctional acetaldehyde-CoA/alcohol dehydrogenase [Le